LSHQAAGITYLSSGIRTLLANHGLYQVGIAQYIFRAARAVDEWGRVLHPERFRRSILAAARRGGVPECLTVVRPAALIPA
jgi:hypothetical protein